MKILKDQSKLLHGINEPDATLIPDRKVHHKGLRKYKTEAPWPRAIGTARSDELVAWRRSFPRVLVERSHSIPRRVNMHYFPQRAGWLPLTRYAHPSRRAAGGGPAGEVRSPRRCVLQHTAVATETPSHGATL